MTQISTDSDAAWQQSKHEVGGSYYAFSMRPGSMVTLVFDGRSGAAQSKDFVYLKNISATQSGLTAEYVVADNDINLSARLLIAETAADLPLNGGNNYTAYPIDAASGLLTQAGTFANSTYYAMIETNKMGLRAYSDIVQFTVGERVESEFAYLTLAGKDSVSVPYSDQLSLGANYSVYDKAFGLDELTGKKWGFISSDSLPNRSDVLGEHLRYAHSSREITYRYQVEPGKSYNLYLGFYDVWRRNNRSIDIYVNGTLVDDSLTNVRTYTAKLFQDVRGETLTQNGEHGESAGETYITVTLRQRNDNSEAPIINVISIQEEGAENILIRGDRQQDISYEVGTALQLPQEVRFTGTSDYIEVSDFEFDRVDYSLLQIPYNIVSIEGWSKQYQTTFTQQVNVHSDYNTDQVYYYFDCGNYIATQGDYSEVASMNPMLQNTAPDMISDGTTAGRSGAYDVFWENDKDVFYSVLEGVSSEAYNGGNRRKIEYVLPNLPQGNYVLTLGLFDYWDANRTIDVLIDNAKIGSYKMQGRLQVEEKFEFTMEERGGITLKLIAASGNQAPMLSYFFVTMVADLGLPVPQAPSVDASYLLKDETIVRVSNFAQDYIVVLSDQNGQMLADHLVTAEDVTRGYIDFDNLDLTKVTQLNVVNYFNGVDSLACTVDAPRLFLSQPRTSWSASPETIFITYGTSSGLDELTLQRPGETRWTDIRSAKFFRADQNGEYRVRMLTRSGVEVIESVVVTHVDRISVALSDDAEHIVNRDVVVTLAPNAGEMANAVATVQVRDGGRLIDITDTLTEAGYSYRVGENCEIVFVVTSVEGGVREFTYRVTQIDKTPIEFTLAHAYEQGVGGVRLNVVANHETRVYVTVGEERSRVFEPFYALTKYGRYVFRLVSETGVEIERVVEFSDGASQLSGTALTVDGGAQVVRLDAEGSSLPVINGVATLQESGLYYLMQTDDNGVLHVAQVCMQTMGQGETPSENNDWIIYVGVVSGIVCGAALFGALWFINKKKGGDRA